MNKYEIELDYSEFLRVKVKPHSSVLEELNKKYQKLEKKYEDFDPRNVAGGYDSEEFTKGIKKEIDSVVLEIKTEMEKINEIEVPNDFKDKFKDIRQKIFHNFADVAINLKTISNSKKVDYFKDLGHVFQTLIDTTNKTYQKENVILPVLELLENFLREMENYKSNMMSFLNKFPEKKGTFSNLLALLGDKDYVYPAGIPLLKTPIELTKGNEIAELKGVISFLHTVHSEVSNNHTFQNLVVKKPSFFKRFAFQLDKCLTGIRLYLNPINWVRPRKVFPAERYWYGKTVQEYYNYRNGPRIDLFNKDMEKVSNLFFSSLHQKHVQLLSHEDDIVRLKESAVKNAKQTKEEEAKSSASQTNRETRKNLSR